jgi:hypothetical protein
MPRPRGCGSSRSSSRIDFGAPTGPLHKRPVCGPYAATRTAPARKSGDPRRRSRIGARRTGCRSLAESNLYAGARAGPAQTPGMRDLYAVTTARAGAGFPPQPPLTRINSQAARQSCSGPSPTHETQPSPASLKSCKTSDVLIYIRCVAPSRGRGVPGPVRKTAGSHLLDDRYRRKVRVAARVGDYRSG